MKEKIPSYAWTVSFILVHGRQERLRYYSCLQRLTMISKSAALVLIFSLVLLLSCSTVRAEVDVTLVELEICKLDGREGCASVVLEVYKSWAPKGAARFLELVRAGHYTNTKFFRVIKNFMAQIGIGADPVEQAVWRNKPIKDDPVKASNKRGHVTFATAGPDTRSMQIFFNFKDNSFLDKQGFSPFAKVSGNGMQDVIDRLHVTGEGQPSGPGPKQNLVQSQGNKYLDKNYPSLSYIKTAKVLYDHALEKEKVLRGKAQVQQRAMPKDRQGLDIPVDAHGDNSLGDKIADSDDEGINSTVKYGAWFMAAMVLFMCACMVPRSAFGSSNGGVRRDD